MTGVRKALSERVESKDRSFGAAVADGSGHHVDLECESQSLSTCCRGPNGGRAALRSLLTGVTVAVAP